MSVHRLKRLKYGRCGLSGEDLVIEWIDLQAVKSAKMLSGIINTASETSNIFDACVVVIQLREPIGTDHS